MITGELIKNILPFIAEVPSTFKNIYIAYFNNFEEDKKIIKEFLERFKEQNIVISYCLNHSKENVGQGMNWID